MKNEFNFNLLKAGTLVIDVISRPVDKGHVRTAGKPGTGLKVISLLTSGRRRYGSP